MDTLLRYEPIASPILMLVLTALIWPYLGRLYRLHREQNLMIKKKIFEHTGVVIFGLFDGKLQSDYLGGFLTTLFGETLFDLIVDWNDKPSPNIIVPDNEYQSDHLQEILAAHASPYVLQSNRIDCYFEHVQPYGTPTYQFAKLVVALARPDATNLAAHDYPRVIIVELENLKRIMDEDVVPQHENRDGYTWLETVRELGKRYFGGEHQGIAVLEVPLSRRETDAKRTVPNRPTAAAPAASGPELRRSA